MSENPTPPIFGWIKDNWIWLSAITVAVSSLVWAWVKHAILNKINTIGGVQRKIVRVIPVEALEKGHLLATQDMCSALRANCQNHMISEELMATMTIMKQAMALVINHNRDIPQEQKDDILQDLVR
jgi:hypothetical protein